MTMMFLDGLLHRSAVKVLAFEAEMGGISGSLQSRMQASQRTVMALDVRLFRAVSKAVLEGRLQ